MYKDLNTESEFSKNQDKFPAAFRQPSAFKNFSKIFL